jgi:hypothetical protein
MRAFAEAYPDIVQEGLAQIIWHHNLALLDKLEALIIGSGMPKATFP